MPRRRLERRTMRLDRKASDFEGRRIRGYGSTFEDPERHDTYGDIIAPGAFDDTIARHAAGEHRVKMLADHRDAIGLFDELDTDERGFIVDGFVSKTPRGDEALTLAKDEVYDGLSIGFYVDDYTWHDSAKTPWGTPVRVVTKADVVEVSLTPFPANRFATVESVRAMRSREWRASCACQAEAKGVELAAEINAALEAKIVDGEWTLEELTEELAFVADLEIEAVEELLAGADVCPTLDALDAFAEVLGVDVEKLRAAAEADGCEYEEAAEDEEAAGDESEGMDDDAEASDEESEARALERANDHARRLDALLASME